MSLETTAYLQRLSEKPERTRNFCMVAHVDHGKTTLSDYLVASNGILSPQLAGEVRLLDSRPDEQERCITMKASSIALRHVHKGVEHLLNLVDSPGHIDFSCEVSTAMRLCDGAVIIVDVVDGVTQQTSSMLRHAYREGLSMCLVLNKVDLLLWCSKLPQRRHITECVPLWNHATLRLLLLPINSRFRRVRNLSCIKIVVILVMMYGSARRKATYSFVVATMDGPSRPIFLLLSTRANWILPICIHLFGESIILMPKQRPSI
ncbi:putative translation elongation factor EF-2 [Trypanosoma cruzi]|uniref:Putative translation elongation factor EF-2 n=1 Tax=Trypanosoma cruzi TaxID=5693 RepID=A0A2V2VWD8_TRYCR|nr:putative translation elongation factor EF-2 [Trypanosoma cruzi]